MPTTPRSIQPVVMFWLISELNMNTALAQAGRPGEATVSWQRAAALFDSLRDPQATSLRSRLAALTEHGWRRSSG